MYIVVFVTAPSREEARRIAAGLIADKLAACVNIAGGITSVFRWKGKVETAREALLIIKSKKSLLPGIITRVKSLHSYEVPEIIALPVAGGCKPYLEWIDESVGVRESR